jgi:hypothetical protein
MLSSPNKKFNENEGSSELEEEIGEENKKTVKKFSA